jgi:hypothetical protein
MLDQKVHYRVLKGFSLFAYLSEIIPVNTTVSYISKINFNNIRPSRLGLPGGLFLSGFPTNIPYAFFFPPNRVLMSCSSHFP